MTIIHSSVDILVFVDLMSCTVYAISVSAVVFLYYYCYIIIVICSLLFSYVVIFYLG